MKKILFKITGILISVLCLSGCIIGPSDDYSHVYHLTGANRGDIFLVKYNTTDYDIDYTHTGYIPSNPERSAEIEEMNSVQSDFLPPFEKNVNEHIVQLNAEVMASLKNDSRAVSNDPVVVTEEDYNVGDTREFYYLGKDSKYVKGNATCKAVGDYCYVWYIDDISLKNNGFDLSDSDYTVNGGTAYSDGKKVEEDCRFGTLANKFDGICNLEEKYLGSHIYKSKAYTNMINPTRKINILLADLYGDASKDQSSGTYGYFSQTDMLTSDKYLTNKTMMLYLDSYFYKIDTQSVYSTIVHEYNHLLNFVQKTVVNGKSFSTWYTEMLALVAEDMFQQYLRIEDSSSPKNRLPYYLNFAELGFTTWRSGNDVFKSYANAFAFGAYIARNYGGTEIIKEIATNPYGDFDSITRATGETKDLLLKNFAISYLAPTKSSGDYTGTSVYSLYKSANTNSSDRIYFTPIDLTKLSYWREATIEEISNPNIETRLSGNKYVVKDYYKPIIYYAGNYRPENSPSNDFNRVEYYTIGLDPTGFSIHYVGRNVSNFDFKLKEYSDSSKNISYTVVPIK